MLKVSAKEFAPLTVIVGQVMIRLKFCVAVGATPFAAVMTRGYVFAPVSDPPSVAVPLPWSVNVAPAGKPDWLSPAVGKPVAVNVKLSVEPDCALYEFALVMAGAWSTVSVNVCVAFGETPLLAVIVMT